jgi:hypothetical protein
VPTDPSPGDRPANARFDAIAAVLGLVVLVAAWIWLYAPMPTTLPNVYNDDLILMQAAESFARDGSLTFPINSSPFADPAVIGSAAKVHAVLEEGYFIAMGLWFRVRGATVTEARRFSAVAGLLFVVAACALFCRLVPPPLAMAACLVTLLDNNFWNTARTVRPDLPTASLAMLSLLLLVLGRRSAGRRALGLALASGLAMGAASTMHPNWALYILPWLILFALPRPGPGPRFFAVFMVGALLVFTPYALDIAHRWGEVQKTLQVHQAHNDILEHTNRAPGIWRYQWTFANLAAEPSRYLVPSGFDFNAATRRWMLALQMAALIWVGIRLAWRRDASSALALAISVVVMASLAVFVTYKVGHYLVHVLPWLNLVVALALYDALTLVTPRRAMGIAAAAIGICALGYGAFTARSYASVYRSYREAGVASYEDIAAILARALPPNALLFSAPNGWPVALDARSTFLSNQMLPYEQVDLPGFPWKVVPDGTHLLDYTLDVDKMRELARRSGQRIFFLADESDWAWNGYYPFGAQYGASYAQLQADLARWFHPVADLVTGPRGELTLYEFGPASGAPSEWVEAAPIHVAPRLLYALERPIRLLPAASAHPFVHLEKVRGIDLRVTVRGTCHDKASVYPYVSGDTATAWNVLRYLDAPASIRYRFHARPETDAVDISLNFIQPVGSMDLEELRVEAYAPAGEAEGRVGAVTATPTAPPPW